VVSHLAEVWAGFVVDQTEEEKVKNPATRTFEWKIPQISQVWKCDLYIVEEDFEVGYGVVVDREGFEVWQ